MNTIRQTDKFERWLDEQGITVQLRIVSAIDKAKLGNFGDTKSVGGGVYEMRLHFGAGYRLYYAQEGKLIYLLLNGGDKSTQKRDIKEAISIWKTVQEEQS